MTRSLPLLTAAFAAVFICAGCATTDPAAAKAQADAMVMAGQVRVAEANAAAEEARAVIALSAKVDAGGASAYLVAKALKGLGQAPQPQIVVQQPRGLLETAWATALQVADIALRGYGIRAGRDTAIAATNANRDTSIASYGAFTTMGGHIATAGVAGYPYVQAPAPNVTLSGTGVIGSGSYVGPVTTTRNCAGGTGAAGGAGGVGTDVGGAGAAGGSGQGGSC